MFDFTLKMYRRLCWELAESGYISVRMGDYYSVKATSQEARVFLRHDIDRRPFSALNLVKIEKEFGLSATYFFRCVGSAFNPQVIAQVHDQGMEVGYHYECLDRAKGNYEMALQICKSDLEKLREIAPVVSMAMHGNPLTSYDNRDLWKKYDFHELGIKVAAYLSLDYTQIRYYTDTGRNWDEQRGNLYDQVDTPAAVRLTSTPKLIQFLRANKQDTCILTHPNRWSDNPLTWIGSAIYDHTGNAVKEIIKLTRYRRHRGD
ncbi:MAG: hypothetical protein KAT58_09500 [candidate division Zixibacteria bacterium]|nr:hypothetical protein [candidate division Zixibacteria bacterium]